MTSSGWTRQHRCEYRQTTVQEPWALQEFAIYNVLNVDTILVQNNSFGGSLDNITAIIDGRVMRVGVNITF